MALRLLLVLLGLTFVAGAQQPDDPSSRPAPAKESAQDPEVDAWVDVLIERMNHPHELIRGSAQEAIMRLGRAALPRLKAAAEGTVEKRAALAKDLAQRIEQRRGPKPDGGPDERRIPKDQLENHLASAMRAARLTPEQEVKVKARFEEQRRKTQELYAQARDGVLTREEVRAAMQDMEKGLPAALGAFLDEAQVKTFLDTLRMPIQRGNPPGNPGNPGPRRRPDGGQ